MTDIISKIPLFIRRVSLLLIAGVLLISVARAQISPGELHRAHAFLEGVDNCSKCHGGSTEQIPSKCLACHTAIAAGRPNRKDCTAILTIKIVNSVMSSIRGGIMN